MGKFDGSEVKVAQSCPTLCDPMDYVVHGILQAYIILKWVFKEVPFSHQASLSIYVCVC